MEKLKMLPAAVRRTLLHEKRRSLETAKNNSKLNKLKKEIEKLQILVNKNEQREKNEIQRMRNRRRNALKRLANDREKRGY